ncbi:MAG: ABC transporter permease [Acidobacteria bacterium]|nr:ABC transporter permease [Acidobacteriota bacterium]
MDLVSFFAHLLRRLALLVAAALAGGALVRLSPGFTVDERSLDPLLSRQSAESIARDRAEFENLAVFYGRYFRKLARLDLGNSVSLGRPIQELLSERMPVTLKMASLGLAAGWGIGLLLAMGTGLRNPRAANAVGGLLSSSFLSAPEAVLALACAMAGIPAAWAVALVVFPRVYRFGRNLLARTLESPHVVAALARGLKPLRVMLWHVAPVAGPEMLALAGVSVSIAFGAAIPIEVVTDTPGIGQLAWQAALGRDLPLLVTLTLMVTAMIVAANTAADAAVHMTSAERK